MEEYANHLHNFEYTYLVERRILPDIEAQPLFIDMTFAILALSSFQST